MTLPKYGTYRESGVEWLGQIPARWEIDRLKRRCEVFPSNVDKKSIDGEQSVRLCNYTDVYYSDRITPAMSFMQATATRDQIDRFGLRAGDTIFTKDSETADDIGVSALVDADMPDVVCGYHLSIARPRSGTHGAFVKRLFDAHFTKARFAVLANGLTRVGLNQYAVDNLELPWPPLEEQIAIASFLDRETAKIDAMIAEQERLLALLAAKRQASISHAVTRGLDPTAPLKDSGIPWLGEVPKHWRVQLLKRAFASIDYGISESLSLDGDTAVLRMGNIQNGRVMLEDLRFVNSVEEGLLLREGDLLFNRTNSLDLVGKVGLFCGGVSGPVSFASYLVRLRCSSEYEPRYFSYLC